MSPTNRGNRKGTRVATGILEQEYGRDKRRRGDYRRDYGGEVQDNVRRRRTRRDDERVDKANRAHSINEADKAEKPSNRAELEQGARVE